MTFGLQPVQPEEIRSVLCAMSKSYVAFLTMAVMVFGANEPEAIAGLLDAVRAEFPEITSLLYVINTKVNDTIGDQEVLLHSGSEFIEEEMEGLKFRVGPKSFYQTNSLQAYELYKVTRDFAGLSGDELVYDLYTGTGTIANFVSRRARKVVGIEYVPEAIEDAKSTRKSTVLTTLCSMPAT